MKPKTNRRLTLDCETTRVLEARDLGHVAGGTGPGPGPGFYYGGGYHGQFQMQVGGFGPWGVWGSGSAYHW